VGWKYIARHAVRPFLLLLIPFLSLLGMKPGQRNRLAILDESARVGWRALAWAFGGDPGLLALLVWQLIFHLAIIYLNYLQHFELEEGHGTVWNQSFFYSGDVERCPGQATVCP
jgi:hypothetical protein